MERVPNNPLRHDSNPLASLLLLFAAALLLPACGTPSDPDKIALGFVNAYYVTVDLPQAKKLTSGLATRKVEQEQALLEGMNPDGGTRRRDVSSRLLERRDEGERIQFVYELTIKGRGVPPLKKRVLFSVGQVDAAWRITNFRDFDS